ncbi:MAG: hypothetical protein AVDCRST_MAG27-530, partial [uncultured Craurococcus sp.]
GRLFPGHHPAHDHRAGVAEPHHPDAGRHADPVAGRLRPDLRAGALRHPHHAADRAAPQQVMGPEAWGVRRSSPSSSSSSSIPEARGLQAGI